MIIRLRLAAIATALAAIFAGPITARAQTSPWDDTTAQAIVSAIQKTPALSGSAITVDCYAGIVMLTGIVPNFELRDIVEQTVRQTPGTNRIIDELNQDADRNATDAQRDAVIQSTLEMTLAQYASGSPPVVVARGRVYDGIVYLLGSVSDPAMNDILQSSIMGLPGVHAVVAHLAVQQKPPAPARSLPPPEAVASLPQALAKVHKKSRKITPREEDETADRLTRAAPQATPNRSYSVQLASEPDEATAHAAWKRKRAANTDLLADLEPTVTRADLAAKGIRYRLKAGPLPDQAAAIALCAELTKRHTACMVVRDETGPSVATGGETAARIAAPAKHANPSSTKRAAAEPEAAVAAPALPKPKRAASAPQSATSLPAREKASREVPFYVQLASRASDTAARDYWSAQRAAHADLLGGLSPVVTSANLGAKGIMYRLKAGPLSDHAAAAALCAQLAKRQLDCLVVRDLPPRPAP